MALKSVKDLAIRTQRDEQRRQEREDLAYQWAVIDSHIAEALGSSSTMDADLKEPLP